MQDFEKHCNTDLLCEWARIEQWEWKQSVGKSPKLLLLQGFFLSDSECENVENNVNAGTETKKF